MPNSQISGLVTAVRDIMTAGHQKSDLNMERLHKNQLQSYAQKRNLKPPVYSSKWVGPSHDARFKCKVTIDGQTNESTEFFPTLKDAEHGAANVALTSLVPDGAQEIDNGLYKNLLEQFVQKKGLDLPVYSTRKSGPAPMPTFVSNVELGGETFVGKESTTKKLAMMNAAKVAYTILKERKGKSEQSFLFPSSTHQGQAPEFSSSYFKSNVATGLQQHAYTKSSVRSCLGLDMKSQSEKDKGKLSHQGHAPEFSSSCSESNAATGHQHHENAKSLVRSTLGSVTKNQSEKGKGKIGCTEDASLPSDQSAPPHSGRTNMFTGSGSGSSDMPSTGESAPRCRKMKPVVVTGKIGCAEDASVPNGRTAPPLSSRTNTVTGSGSGSGNMPSTAESAARCRKLRVIICLRKTNMPIKEGGTLLPINDKNWVAYEYKR